MEYIKIENEIDCIEADTLFNELIKYESNLDNVINGNANIEGINKEMMSKSNVFLYMAKDNDKPVGYIFAYLKNPYSSVITTNVIMLEALYVKEEYRAKGVGKHLMTLLEKWAQNSFDKYAIEIVCISNNENAMKFYERMGYNNVKTILRK